MLLGKTVIVLDETELITLRRILTDEDRAEALRFITYINDGKLVSEEHDNTPPAGSPSEKSPASAKTAGKRVAITLDDEQVNLIRETIRSSSEKSAMLIMKEIFEPKVKEAELPHCVPVFEASYHPGIQERFKPQKP